MITDFIFRESQNKDKENTKYFKNHFTEISNYDFSQLSKDEINQILLNILADSWTKEMDKSQDIIDKYQQNWNEINDDVMKGLSKRLNINWPSDFSNIIARFGVKCLSQIYKSKNI